MTPSRTPLSTYRIQFNANFRFPDAQRILPYLASLGITDVYGSPILKARPGSQHGYDVVDAAALNPELGTAEDFESLTGAMKRLDIGFLLDVVPNHMAASSDNEWWMSLLENGPDSRYINYFDIDLEELSKTGGEKVLLPVLAKPYGEVLENGELELRFDAKGFSIAYFDRRFPIAPHSYSRILEQCLETARARPHLLGSTERELRELISGSNPGGGEPLQLSRPVNSRFLKDVIWRLHETDPAFQAGVRFTCGRINGKRGEQETFSELDRLLDEQWYRLAYWKMASEGINYRRFFDITDLIGIRIEEPEVFEARHSRIFSLIDEGKITGLRIDHIDGLYDPVAHLRKLQSRISPHATDRFHVVVEKILARGETLPEEFEAAGTTGYEFLNLVNDLFVDAEGAEKLDISYRQTSGRPTAYEEISYRRKKQVIAALFPGEIRRLSTRLYAIASHDRHARDFTPAELLEALIEITASLQVYRTYIRDFTVPARDRKRLEQAFEKAATSIDRHVFDFVRRVLLLQIPPYANERKAEWLDFVMRWQQFTGRVMAKGVEDTAFYIYNRLISLNEVGGEPDRDLHDVVARFHQENAARALLWPHTLNASSTHDTKRSEDVRARINVLSEIADEWRVATRRWSRMNRKLRVAEGDDAAPDANEEWLIYQTLLGIWPLEQEGEADLPARLDEWIEKSLREAKEHSSWLEPDLDYENAVKTFIRRVISPENRRFLEELRPLQGRIAFYGFLNALSQVVLKITSPGIPDFYQGTELWDFSLVDPDNRRRVDFAQREQILAAIRTTPSPAAALLRKWTDGRIKLFVTDAALQLRRRSEAAFREGSYIPLTISGEFSDHICSFARTNSGSLVEAASTTSTSDGSSVKWVITVVPRLITSLVRRGQQPLGFPVWRDTRISLPDHAPRTWRNVFTGETLHVDGDGVLPIGTLFETFPLALIENI